MDNNNQIAPYCIEQDQIVLNRFQFHEIEIASNCILLFCMSDLLSLNRIVAHVSDTIESTWKGELHTPCILVMLLDKGKGVTKIMNDTSCYFPYLSPPLFPFFLNTHNSTRTLNERLLTRLRL